MRLLAPAALAALALAAAPGNAAAQHALRTSSDGSQGAYCVWTSGDNAATGTCDSGYNVFRAQWSPSDRPSGVIRIAKGDGSCLDASGGPGRPVRTLRCNGGAAQGWTIHSTGQIESQQHAGQCLDVAGGIGHNRQVVLFGCDYATPTTRRRDNQRFAFGAVKPRAAVSAATTATGSGMEAAGVRIDTRSGVASVVSAGGANVVSAGGGNVVAAGSANVVSAGGGN